jgi:hypothetical protein
LPKTTQGGNQVKTVAGIFTARDAVERAINDLRLQGFDKEISVVTKGDRWEGGRGAGDSVLEGTYTGGAVGGLAGLAAGAGALAIPGIGPIVAAGPIAGLLSGAATGGIAGGLLDWGIPAQRGRHYEERVKQGNTLVSVRTGEDRVLMAADVLRRHGAQDVETY